MRAHSQAPSFICCHEFRAASAKVAASAPIKSPGLSSQHSACCFLTPTLHKAGPSAMHRGLEEVGQCRAAKEPGRPWPCPIPPLLHSPQNSSLRSRAETLPSRKGWGKLPGSQALKHQPAGDLHSLAGGHHSGRPSAPSQSGPPPPSAMSRPLTDQGRRESRSACVAWPVWRM